MVDSLKHWRWHVHFNGYFRRHLGLAVFLDGGPHILHIGRQLKVSGARNLRCRSLNRDHRTALEQRNRLFKGVRFHPRQKCHVKKIKIL